MAGQARVLRMSTGCESPVIITARACPAPPALLAQPLTYRDVRAALRWLADAFGWEPHVLDGQGLGNVPECRVHGLVIRRSARVPPCGTTPPPRSSSLSAAHRALCDEVEACAGQLLDVTGSLSAKLGHRA
jgi:hypothetical protein